MVGVVASKDMLRNHGALDYKAVVISRCSMRAENAESLRSPPSTSDRERRKRPEQCFGYRNHTQLLRRTIDLRDTQLENGFRNLSVKQLNTRLALVRKC